MASGHARKPSGRAAVPRRATKGPLDAPDDPLSITTPSTTLPTRSNNHSPSLNIEPHSPSRIASSPDPSENIDISLKDLSFLQTPAIYHPLSQLEIPVPFRGLFSGLVPGDTLSSSLATLDDLLSKGKFLPAAHLSAVILTSDSVKPTDLSTIFRLLQTRYSCLELTGNTLLAAQESKALEDLNSAFYFLSTGGETPIDGERMETHIMPYSLRLQALRLQSIGFGDPRRGISSLYDLGLECREQIALPGTSKEERDLWRNRLQDLGIRVVNALVEMGDLDTAKQTLRSSMPTDTSKGSLDMEALTRITLLQLKIGDTASARSLLERHPMATTSLLQPLVCVAEGRWNDAVREWEHLQTESTSETEQAIIKQNLAVCLLYIGRLREARELMETIVTDGYGFQSLTFNLATLYELSTSNAASSKRQLAERVAQHHGDAGQNWGRSNADFKL